MLQEPDEQKNLRCWYETKRTPYLTISPVKSELLSEHPVIVQYYDVLNSQWIEKIKASAARYLARSTVINEATGGSKTAASRTSLNSWIADFYMDEYKKLPHIIHSITGMNVYDREECEELQVASYAFGGHYDVHMDAVSYHSST